MDVQVKGDAVVLTLDRPWAPLLTTFLADLPILPSDGLRASLDRLVAGAKAGRPQGPRRVDRAHLRRGQRGGMRCATRRPPPARPAEHVDELAGWLAKAGVTAPLPERYADESGTVDGDAYGIALLAAVDALADVLGRPGAGATPAPVRRRCRCHRSTAWPRPCRCSTSSRAPVGTGPYRLVRLRARRAASCSSVGGLAAAGAPRRVQAVILRDAVEAATALQSGQIDWLPTVAPEVVPVLEIASHPGRRGAAVGAVRAIVFNVRDGHPCADPSARQAFSRCPRPRHAGGRHPGRARPACLDPGGAGVVGGAAVQAPRRRPCRRARALLETAGYVLG